VAWDRRAYDKEWRDDNPGKKKAYNKKWRDANPEKVKANNRQWREANPEKAKANGRQWRDANPEKSAAANKKYRDENPTYSKQWARAGNANKFGISLEDALALQDNRCAMCLETEPRSNQGNLLPWAFDHDHACCPSGKGCPDCFRGVLCSNCNRSLGYAKDSATIMQRGAEYLAAWDTKKMGPTEGPINLE
jgi:hypothetical protein